MYSSLKNIIDIIDFSASFQLVTLLRNCYSFIFILMSLNGIRK